MNHFLADHRCGAMSSSGCEQLLMETGPEVMHSSIRWASPRSGRSWTDQPCPSPRGAASRSPMTSSNSKPSSVSTSATHCLPRRYSIPSCDGISIQPDAVSRLWMRSGAGASSDRASETNDFFLWWLFLHQLYEGLIGVVSDFFTVAGFPYPPPSLAVQPLTFVTVNRSGRASLLWSAGLSERIHRALQDMPGPFSRQPRASDLGHRSTALCPLF
jgi:hypothetical protein